MAALGCEVWAKRASVTSDGYSFAAVGAQPLVRRHDSIWRSRHRRLRCERVVEDEDGTVRASGELAGKPPVGLGRSGEKPAAMKIENHAIVLGHRRSHPPAAHRRGFDLLGRDALRERGCGDERVVNGSPVAGRRTPELSESRTQLPFTIAIGGGEWKADCRGAVRVGPGRRLRV